MLKESSVGLGIVLVDGLLSVDSVPGSCFIGVGAVWSRFGVVMGPIIPQDGGG